MKRCRKIKSEAPVGEKPCEDASFWLYKKQTVASLQISFTNCNYGNISFPTFWKYGAFQICNLRTKHFFVIFELVICGFAVCELKLFADLKFPKVCETCSPYIYSILCSKSSCTKLLKIIMKRRL